MNSNQLKYLVLALCGMFSMQAIAQHSVEPSYVASSIAEATGDGCGEVTNCVEGRVCFDVYFEVDQPGWNLQSYNIWLNYGKDNSILTYASDGACHHEDGGDVNFDKFGKYRVLAAQVGLALDANQATIIHNFCLNVKDMNRLTGLSCEAGNNQYELVSSVNLVDQKDQSHAIHKHVTGAMLTLNHNTLSCIKESKPTLSDVSFADFKGEEDKQKVIIDNTTTVSTDEQVYPVPFVNELNFNLGTPGKYKVELYSSAGELVKNVTVNDRDVLSVGNLSSGIYLLKATNAQGVEVYAKTIVKANQK